MRIAVVLYRLQRLSNASHVGTAADVQRRQRAGGLQLVDTSVFGHPQPIDAPDVLAPSYYLTNEALRRLNRHLAGPIGGINCVAHVAWQQKTEVQIRAECRVCHRPFPGQHRILMRPKYGKNLRDEVVEPAFRLAGRGSPCSVGRRAECTVGET